MQIRQECDAPRAAGRFNALPAGLPGTRDARTATTSAASRSPGGRLGPGVSSHPERAGQGVERGATRNEGVALAAAIQIYGWDSKNHKENMSREVSRSHTATNNYRFLEEARLTITCNGVPKSYQL